jgi:hypothetical protein
MIGAFKSIVARCIPFDNASNGFSSTNVQEAIEEVTSFNPEFNPIALFDDFDDRMAWSPATSGTGAAASVSAGNATLASGGHLGVARIASGTAVASTAALAWSGALANAIVLGTGESAYVSLIRLPILATVANDYILRIGLGTSTSADHTDGVYFEYNRATSANWICKTASQSTRTSTTTSVAVAINTWIKLEWRCNSAGTSVEFFINGVSVATITTNIPTVTGKGCGGNFQIVNVAGTLARECFIDYFYFTKSFTSRA